jgi:hypothetical protein
MVQQRKPEECAEIASGGEHARPMSLEASEAAYDERCNEGQVAAVAALREGAFLVHGPLGTGAPHRVAACRTWSCLNL